MLYLTRLLYSIIALVLCLFIAGCGTPAASDRGETAAAPLTPGELVQSDVNRLATLGMRDNLDSLYRLMSKLYLRNPSEWRKTHPTHRKIAEQQVRDAIENKQAWPALNDLRDIAALSLALSPDFQGDRVAAFIYASADMLITAHQGKTTFFLIDGLDAQYLYNAARNMESAIWLLATRKNASGKPLLLADEINEHTRNLSFEREFGKIIGRVDLLSELVNEKYRRAAISYIQNFVGGTFLQFLPVQ